MYIPAVQDIGMVKQRRLVTSMLSSTVKDLHESWPYTSSSIGGARETQLTKIYVLKYFIDIINCRFASQYCSKRSIESRLFNLNNVDDWRLGKRRWWGRLRPSKIWSTSCLKALWIALKINKLDNWSSISSHSFPYADKNSNGLMGIIRSISHRSPCLGIP